MWINSSDVTLQTTQLNNIPMSCGGRGLANRVAEQIFRLVDELLISGPISFC